MTGALALGLTLTKGLREALPFLDSLIDEEPELSARAIIRMLRSQGLGFRDSDAFALIGQLKSNLNARKLFKLTGLDDIPSLDTLEKAVTPLGKDFSFLVKISGFDRNLGERVNRFVTVVSDTLLSLNEILDIAAQAPQGKEGSEALINSRSEVISGKRSPLARR